MPKYTAGTLMHRVTVQKINRTYTNELGEVEANHWDTIGSRAASIRSIRAMEKIRNAVAVADITHTIVMRWFPDFNSTDYRLVFKGRILDLVSVTDPDERRDWWEITANESQGAGNG